MVAVILFPAGAGGKNLNCFAIVEPNQIFRGAGGNRTRAIEVLQTPAFPLRHCTITGSYINYRCEAS